MPPIVIILLMSRCVDATSSSLTGWRIATRRILIRQRINRLRLRAIQPWPMGGLFTMQRTARRCNASMTTSLSCGLTMKDAVRSSANGSCSLADRHVNGPVREIALWEALGPSDRNSVNRAYEHGGEVSPCLSRLSIEPMHLIKDSCPAKTGPQKQHCKGQCAL
jgi:hypothetical protein